MTRSSVYLFVTTFIGAIISAFVYRMTRPGQPNRWTYQAQSGFFSHDDDPESWDFRATTRPGLGLLNREYPTDGGFDQKHERTQWERFEHYVKSLNELDPDSKRYKVLYITRHGEGVHNVKEKEVGRQEWERHWARVPGDGTTTWADAELTPHGEQQAKSLSTFWADAFDNAKIPAPDVSYSSPLRRCLRTLELASASVSTDRSLTFNPVIKEKLRERLGVHTCDRRSTKSWIKSAYPAYKVEDGFTEEDELWNPDVRETLEEHIERTTLLLHDIFAEKESTFVSLTAHSGVLMSIFGATGHKKIPVAAGAVYPLLVLAQKS